MKRKAGVFLLSAALMMSGGVGAIHSQAAAVVMEAAYEFQTGTVTVKMHQEMSGLINLLGKTEGYFEAESCAYQGIDKIYTYQSFEISTYPVKGKDYVGSVYFLDNTVSTKEGIKIGSTFDDMVKAYGNGYKEQNSVYRYSSGDCELSFYINSSKKITNIEYLAVKK